MNEVDTNLFKSIYQQYSGMVLHVCRGFMKGDQDLAYDLTQDVFVNVWNALPGFRVEASHKTWIYRITVNTCLLQIRKNKNKIKVPLENVTDTTEIVESTMAQEEENILYRAIGQLDEVDRLIIMMVLEEVEQSEVARIMGITENNLRVKIHRIKVKIKTTIEDERRKNR